MPRDKFPTSVSAPEIEKCATNLRSLLGVGNSSYFNIIEAIEILLPQRFPNFFVEVVSPEKMGAIEAFTDFGPTRVSIRQDVYDNAYRDEARSRFTIAHELGHLCLHWGYPRPRLPLALAKKRFHRSRNEKRLESEANRFAAAFLMPKAIAYKFDAPKGLAKLCRVSELAASCRLNDLWLQGDELEAKAVRTLFGTGID